MGELSAAETQEVIDMAARYPAVRQEIGWIEDTLLGMAETLAVQPATGIFENIKTSIKNKEAEPVETPTAMKNRKIHYWRYGVAATFTLKLVAIVVAANFWVNWQHTERKLSHMQQKYTQLEQNAQQVTHALLAIADPGFQTVILENETPESDARVLAYWNKETQELYLNLSKLPKQEQDRQYQLWGLVDGKSVSLGLFSIAANASLPQIKPFKGSAGLTTLLISLEPAGGSNSPSRDQIYYEGEVR